MPLFSVSLAGQGTDTKNSRGRDPPAQFSSIVISSQAGGPFEEAVFRPFTFLDHAIRCGDSAFIRRRQAGVFRKQRDFRVRMGSSMYLPTARFSTVPADRSRSETLIRDGESGSLRIRRGASGREVFRTMAIGSRSTCLRVSGEGARLVNWRFGPRTPVVARRRHRTHLTRHRLPPRGPSKQRS